MPTRREILRAAVAVPLAAAVSVRAGSRAPRVVVVGAGAFGGWTALELVRRGAQVTLVDAWGPGNTRASSGGETRVIRATYGARTIYTTMAKRALELWRAGDAKSGRGFFKKTGALWMFGVDDSFGRASVDALRAAGLPTETLTPAEAARRYPQISFAGVSSVLFEPEAGYLLARRACEFVAERVAIEGGTYKQTSVVTPVKTAGPRLDRLACSDGATLTADAFVFACGPWLPSVFPDVVGPRVAPTRQPVFYFGSPAGDNRFLESSLPVWVDYTSKLIYGIPGNANRGFKLADDTAGAPFDPTNGQREVTSAEIEWARAFVARRFPSLAKAPFIGSEVCQYESSPDSNYIIDRHPSAENVWIAGGGSGHGFKMGPAMGEIVAKAVLGEKAPDAFFSLKRFPRSTGLTLEEAR